MNHFFTFWQILKTVEKRNNKKWHTHTHYYDFLLNKLWYLQIQELVNVHVLCSFWIQWYRDSDKFHVNGAYPVAELFIYNALRSAP